MTDKTKVRLVKYHTPAHMEFYEKKLNLMICGCGNRRLLTTQEEIRFTNTQTLSDGTELVTLKYSQIPAIKRR